MRVLITGGSGFIGSHVADCLIASGHEVLVIDNFDTGRRDNLQPHPQLTLIEGSIADQPLVDRLFDEFQPEQVVHAAASYKDPNNWTADALTNTVGTVHVVQAAERIGVQRLVYFQTALCYGIRPSEQPVSLTHPIWPESSYAISKTAGEQYIQMSKLNYISFRLANAYGPRNLSGPLPTFFHRLTNDKPCFVMDTRRDFIFINDLVDVVMKALNGEGQRGVYHVSSGSDYAIKELFDATVKALGISLKQDVEVRPRGADDAPTILLDPTKTNQNFGWAASTPLEPGVKAAIAWYQQHGITQTYTHLKPVETK
jgi:UDP-glucose 4-epimerase